MEPFTVHRGKAVVLDWTDVNTDLIIPARYLKRVERVGYGPLLFADKRYVAGGSPAPDDPEKHGPPDPAFPLNRPEAAGATILVVGRNFGCGSSREHAVWGLQQYGIDAVIAPSFGEIFYSNAMNNGLLALMLPVEHVASLMDAVDADPALDIVIALDEQVVRAGAWEARFDLAPRHKRMLMAGLDVIGLSLTHAAEIEAFATAQAARSPWLVDVAARVRARVA
jgi:3-isopropylmalate/(R)-2-methylmalate dehydratase small subunit